MIKYRFYDTDITGRENYDINTKTNSLKITCSYDKCKFSKSSGKSNTNML